MKYGLLLLSLGVLLSCQLSEVSNAEDRSSTGVVSIREKSDSEIAKIVPKNAKGTSKYVFDVYKKGLPVAWSRGWTSKINLTGVAWDIPNTGVLISPKHILITAHMGRRQDVPIRFHDSRGKLVERRILTGAENMIRLGKSKTTGSPKIIPNIDLKIMTLDKPVPNSIKVYGFLPPHDKWRNELRGGHAIVTSHRRRVHVGKINGIAGGVLRLTKNIDYNKIHHTQLITGDSSNPSFLLLDGNPVLIEIHTSGGWGSGHFLSDPNIFKELNRCLIKISDGEYSLNTIKLN